MIRFRNYIIWDLFINPETGMITDCDGNVLEERICRGRPYVNLTKYVKERCQPGVHEVQAHTKYGYIKGYDAHHIDENKLNNDLYNLAYIPHEEHKRLHNLTESDNTKKKRKASLKGKNTWSENLYWWSKPGVPSIRAYTKPGDGWVRGRSSYTPPHKGKKFDKTTNSYIIE